MKRKPKILKRFATTTKGNQVYMSEPNKLVVSRVAGKINWSKVDIGQWACDCICHCNSCECSFCSDCSVCQCNCDCNPGQCACTACDCTCSCATCHCDCSVCNCDCDCITTCDCSCDCSDCTCSCDCDCDCKDDKFDPGSLVSRVDDIQSSLDEMTKNMDAKFGQIREILAVIEKKR